MKKLLFNTTNSSEDCNLHSFFEKNIHLLTALGIFGALSILAFDKSDSNLQLLTTISYLLVLFLLIVIVLNAIKLFLLDSFKKINQKLTFIRIWNYFGILFVVTTLFFLCVALYYYLISSSYPIFFLILGIVFIFIGIGLAIFIGLNLIKAYNTTTTAIVFILTTILMGVLSYYIGPSLQSIIFTNLYLYPIIGLFYFIVILWIILFGYFIGVLFNKE